MGRLRGVCVGGGDLRGEVGCTGAPTTPALHCRCKGHPAASAWGSVVPHWLCCIIQWRATERPDALHNPAQVSPPPNTQVHAAPAAPPPRHRRTHAHLQQAFQRAVRAVLQQQRVVVQPHHAVPQLRQEGAVLHCLQGLNFLGRVVVVVVAGLCGGGAGRRGRKWRDGAGIGGVSSSCCWQGGPTGQNAACASRRLAFIPA